MERSGQVALDHATGLIWQQSGSSDYMTLSAAKAYIDNLNRQGFGGHNDWRLPTLKEAMTLMEPEQKSGDLYIDPIFDQKQRWIWTSDKRSASSAWVVDFHVGICTTSHVYDDIYVRAVR